MTPTPLTVSEARAILIADQAMDLSFRERTDHGLVLDPQEIDAWINLVESARQRVVAWDRRSS